jgi:hypothetical protein
MTRLHTVITVTSRGAAAGHVVAATEAAEDAAAPGALAEVEEDVAATRSFRGPRHIELLWYNVCAVAGFFVFFLKKKIV